MGARHLLSEVCVHLAKGQARAGAIGTQDNTQCLDLGSMMVC